MRTSYGTGYSGTAPSEAQYLVGDVEAWAGNGTPIIFCHGGGQLALNWQNDALLRDVMYAWASRGLVIAADLAGDNWGNDTSISRVQDCVNLLKSKGLTGPVGLVGFSMGGLAATTYALNNPDNVKFVAGILSVTDISNIYPANPASVDTAYGGSYVNATHGPTHSPVMYASKLRENLPMFLASASNDSLVPSSTHKAFGNLRPQTTLTDVGALGHTSIGMKAGGLEALDWAISTGLV